jgi:paraquat-inducible protein A
LTAPTGASPGTATPTGAARQLWRCEACALVSRAAPAPLASICPRCGAELHARKPASLARTWALLAAAALLYLPANTLPVMRSSSLFGAQEDTIWSGIVFLWVDGSLGLALLVFFASMVVPLTKLVVLGGLALSIQLRMRGALLWRTKLFRTIESVGRWSMLDIYVVTLLVGLVQLRSVASVQAGPGALAFGAVVVLTMLASLSFDARLMWDAAQAADEPAPGAVSAVHP